MTQSISMGKQARPWGSLASCALASSELTPNFACPPFPSSNDIEMVVHRHPLCHHVCTVIYNIDRYVI